MASLRHIIPALALALLSACHAQLQPQADHAATVPSANGDTAACGDSAALHTAVAAELSQGHAPEASPLGGCLADAARKGSIPAAMLLADSYGRAMFAVQAAAAGSAPLGLDLFGRHIGWLRLAAARGYPAAQWQLAQATDLALEDPLPDITLAWYQAAAENGNAQAMAAIGSAYSGGRIMTGRLYDFRKWLATHAATAPACRQLARLLAKPSAISPPP